MISTSLNKELRIPMRFLIKFSQQTDEPLLIDFYSEMQVFALCFFPPFNEFEKCDSPAEVPS